MNIDRKVEFAFAGSFYDDPATLTWTDLSLSWTDDPRISVKLGRDRDLSAVPQAGKCTFRLASLDGSGVPDGALTPGNTASPYYPNVVSGVPVRVTAQDGDGTWWPVFYGLVESWHPTLVGNLLDWSVVEVVCSTAWTALTQAGARRTYADRVVGDLAPAKGEVWAAGIRDYGYPVCLYVANGVYYGGGNFNNTEVWPTGFISTDPAHQRFGFAWLKLTNTGAKTWATPGAACPVVETGGADTSGFNSSAVLLDGGFAGDRPGGRITVVGSTSTISVGTGASGNYSRVQVTVGRPPTNLAPVGVSAPTSTAGWTASAGALTLVASSTLSHLPRTTAFDPTTLVTSSAVIDGPANSISWAAISAATLRSTPIPVTAGKKYGPLLITTGPVATVVIEWLNAASGIISATTTVAASGGVWGAGGKSWTAPALAVNAQVRLQVNATGTATVGCVGFYEAESTSDLTPARWWPVGADAKVWAWVQWPDPLSGMTGSAVNVNWLHVAIDVTAWDDGALHMLAWNGWPGAAGVPAVWADNVRVTTGWTVSYPGADVGNDVAHTGDGSAMAGGFGWNAGARINTANPAALFVPVALLGASRFEVTPDDVSIGRAWSFFGGRTTLASPVSEPYVADTGAQMTWTLDQLGWPTALRDITTGASVTAQSWADLSSLGDYSALIGNLTAGEYGWVDIGPDGHLRWLPRAWYGVGTATAVAHYTWQEGVAGTFTYVQPLDVIWDDRYTANSIIVTNGVDIKTRSRQDIASQRRGLRKVTVTLPGAVAQSDIDQIADILAVTLAAGPRVDSLTLFVNQNNLPAIKDALSRRTGDVVLVDLPITATITVTLSMLVTSVEHDSDGISADITLGLGICPIPATYP